MIQDISPHFLRNEYLTDVQPEADDPVYFFRGRELALREEADGLVLPRAGEWHFGRSDAGSSAKVLPTAGERQADAGLQFLFGTDGGNAFLARADAALPEGLAFYDVRKLRANPKASRMLVFYAFTALQLASWYRDNVYCGTCGGRTVPGTTERSIICPSCGRTIYPRVIPAVIVGVINGDYLLHTKYERSRDIPFYALVAGFTEIGETLEETVAREVMEETGLKVKNIRYFKSQPWAIADDILAGFYCDVDGDTEIRIDRSELCEGVWIHRSEIRGQPDDASLTHHMMMTFKEGKEPPWRG